MQKATPVHPPEPTRNVVEVDMTQVYLYMGGLALSTAMLGVGTIISLKLQRRNREHIEALSEFTSRMINETDCGHKAYETLLAEYEDEIEAQEQTATWEDEDVFSSDDEHAESPRIRVRRDN